MKSEIVKKLNLQIVICSCILFLLGQPAVARRSIDSCCSDHGGVARCAGALICNDGTECPGVICDPPLPPENLIIEKINSVRRDYLNHHQGFRESLIQDILKLTGGNFLDTIGYYVYTKLPDIK